LRPWAAAFITWFLLTGAWTGLALVEAGAKLDPPLYFCCGAPDIRGLLRKSKLWPKL